MSTVAFIGVGGMGSRMARRLLNAGHAVIVWNRTPAKAEGLITAGAQPATTPAEAAREAEVVITMVADPLALRDVSEGPHGIAAAGTAPTTVIEMSTVGPEAIQGLAETLGDGVGLLDAPVLGSISEAEAGTLNIFVGGPAALVRRWSPLLSVLGTPIPVGPLGSGAAAKLLANTTLLGALTLLGESLALAQGLGLTREVAFDVLAKTPLAAQAERRRPSLEADDYPLRFALSLARKDAELINEAAERVGTDMRLLRAVRSWILDAEEAGLGDQDYSATLAHILAAH